MRDFSLCLIALVVLSCLSCASRDNTQWDHELISAASTGNLKDTIKALDSGANVNVCAGRDAENYTPVMSAAEHGYDSILKVLIAHGADLYAQNRDGDTALVLAVRWKEQAACQLLLEHGSEPNPFRRAVILGNFNRVIDLLNNKIDVNQPDKNGSTPLLLAASLGRTEIVQQLLEHGAKVNQTNQLGHTPLYLAARWGYAPIVKLLLAQRADITLKPKDSKFSAQQVAEIYVHDDIVRLLQNPSPTSR